MNFENYILFVRLYISQHSYIDIIFYCYHSIAKVHNIWINPLIFLRPAFKSYGQLKNSASKFSARQLFLFWILLICFQKEMCCANRKIQAGNDFHVSVVSLSLNICLRQFYLLCISVVYLSSCFIRDDFNNICP